MKKRHLPPLNPLRSFEAAGRHSSFTRAAEELHVTPVAVSRQVAVLEDYFGLVLFERLHQTVRLTPAGRRFLPKVTAALDLLQQGSELLRATPSDAILVCTYATLALSWLIPRLAQFRELRPDIDINITTAVRYSEFNYDKIDVGIQYVDDLPSGVVGQQILPDVIHPVCSPKLLQAGHPLPPVKNLKHHTLLHSQHRRGDWNEWLQANGVARFKPLDEITFQGSGLAYQAATEGLGVALAQRILVVDQIRKGGLVAPFPYAAQRDKGMLMISKRDRLADPRVRVFRDWLEAEATETWRSIGVRSVSLKKGTQLIALN